MQIAIDSNQNRIHINDALANGLYFCPCCGNKMVQRKGLINIHHFAHAKGSECSDNWHYEEMSEWHRIWQEKYPIEYREIVMERDGIKHRADVCISGSVIEFQHSPISAREFQERNDFYSIAGHKVIWLFDGSAVNGMISEDLNVYVYVQMDYGIVDTGGVEILTEEDFVKLSSSGNLGTPSLSHTLYIIRRINGEKEVSGCPVNHDGYAPLIREYNRTTCEECRNCLSINETEVKCSGRYQEYDIKTVIESSDSTLTYMDHQNTAHTVDIKLPKWPGKSILDLAVAYGSNKMIIRNLGNNKKFKIIAPLETYQKYGCIYGYLYNGSYRFSHKGMEVYYSNSPNWIVEWFE